MAATREFLVKQYNHLALPRDVPGSEERDIARVESALLDRVTVAVRDVTSKAPSNHFSHLSAIRLSLNKCKKINVEGSMGKNILLDEFQKLEGDRLLVLRISAQNAAILMYRQDSTCDTSDVVFEAFETSATCEAVLASIDALQWDFPGSAVTLPYRVFKDESFQEHLASSLERATSEYIQRFAAVTFKAAAPQAEIRNTSDPALITGWLMALLEGNGAIHPATPLRKRVRDTVSFDRAYKPWRRSPFYLVIRVAVQRHLYRWLGADLGRLYYKIIMCVVFSNFLNDAHHDLPKEATDFIRQKLGYRVSKLASDSARMMADIGKSFQYVFNAFKPIFTAALSNADGSLAREWKRQRVALERFVPVLRNVAYPLELRLALRNSARFLHEIYPPRYAPTQDTLLPPSQLLAHFANAVGNVKPYVVSARRQIKLAKYEEESVLPVVVDSSVTDPRIRCIELSETIHEYLRQFPSSVDNYSELRSRVLLQVMELWVELDKAALQTCPLLSNYHPGFGVDILDALEILDLVDMQRAYAVQSYIAERCAGKVVLGSQTIFASPSADSFAAQYFDHSNAMLNLRAKIEARAEKLRAAKEEEWKAKSDEHSVMRLQQDQISCVFEAVLDWNNHIEEKHVLPCEWCELEAEKNALRIQVFEHPLQTFEPAAKAAVFELACPEDFAAYRDATWAILAALAYAEVRPTDRISLLSDYSELRSYANRLEKRVSLASQRKSHLRCHYATTGFPIAVDEVCKTCGLRLDYYDSHNRAWVYRQEKVSFLRHFCLQLPSQSPYHGCQFSFETWPTSNEVLESQARCPSKVNALEFTAWQDLLVGTHIRWPNLLRELGATNVNFSLDSTWAIVTRAILEIGPATSDHDAHRDIHAVFLDPNFCGALIEQIQVRIEAIRRNYRESVQMDILVTMLLKIRSCASSLKMRGEALRLLHIVRDTTSAWCADIQKSRSEDQTFAIEPLVWAALLCKRTFHAQFENRAGELSNSLAPFLLASITLQDSLSGQFDSLPYNLRNAVLRDVLFAYDNRDLICETILGNKPKLLEALETLCIPPVDADPTLELVSDTSGSSWVLLTVQSEGRTHYVHYNCVYGILLVDGREIRTLPLEYQKHPTYQELFRNRTFRVLPSSMPGMSFVIVNLMPYGHQVHMGLEPGNSLSVKAVYEGAVLQFISRDNFGNRFSYDLPVSLIDDCFHWLNLSTGDMEIRHRDAWKWKPSSNWWIRLTPQSAVAFRRNSRLVEPSSQIAQSIVKIFKHFEDSDHIMIYEHHDEKTRYKKLCVELSRYELTFFVNSKGLLQCDRLGATIVTDQDAGAWYGLRSKILVQSVSNWSQRSILVPVGNIYCKRYQGHVSVEIERGMGLYVKFDVNNVLGRIECPPEPRLLYMKALLHAYTSHFLPDRLTRRNGREEALDLLQSAAYQPCFSLPEQILDLLSRIAELSPKRKYYPEDLRCMEEVTWHTDFTITMQDDRYRACVERIWRRSADLTKFEVGKNPVSKSFPPSLCGNAHLESRALSRTFKPGRKRDTVYNSRDRRKQTPEVLHVLSTISMIRDWDVNLSKMPDLVPLLTGSPIIGGYTQTFNRTQFSDLLAIDLKANWGALAQSALDSDVSDKYRLMFLYGPMAFCGDVNIDLIGALVSISKIPEVKTVPTPRWPAYHHFRPTKEVPLPYLISFMETAKKPFVAGVYKKRSHEVVAENRHEMDQESSCHRLAKSIQEQWPRENLDLEKLALVDVNLLDLDKALCAIRPEWSRLARNHKLGDYLDDVQQILNRHSSTGLEEEQAGQRIQSKFRETDARPTCPYSIRSKDADLPTLRDILSRKNNGLCNSFGSGHPASNILSRRSGNIMGASTNAVNVLHSNAPYKNHDFRANKPENLPHMRELESIVEELKTSEGREKRVREKQLEFSLERRYALEIEKSIEAFKKHVSRPMNDLPQFNTDQFFGDLKFAKQKFVHDMQHIRNLLTDYDARSHWLQLGGLWPAVTVVTLLKELRSTIETPIHRDTKIALVKWAETITAYQRLYRIEDAYKKRKWQQLSDERGNTGHTNWNPTQHPDWLLLEIDGDIMLREEQVDVARATITPDSGENAVLQLLMGKGKTSCILPMVAADLANLADLARIVVPRALLLQSAQVLQAKLGGLVNREIMHVPFSRKTPTSCELMQLHHDLLDHIRHRRGIMLCLPEHILSFKLSGMQQLCDNRIEEASIMIHTQSWLDLVARDVLDECDVSLAIKTQLIYPSGSQMTVDGHPFRWQTVQTVLRLVAAFSPIVSQRHPGAVETIRRGVGGYPLMYFLTNEAKETLKMLLVDAICDGSESILPCAEMEAADRQAVKTYITNEPKKDVEQSALTLERLFAERSHFMKVATHLRGLFMYRILLSTLDKRWNVQYGLHPLRDPMAVPYLAKGVPNPISEWGHPDVAIVLTCLSFYYEGLSSAQLRRAFEQVIKLDEPNIEYEKWTATGVPVGFSDYASINVEDDYQLTELHKYIRHNTHLVDFYLNNFVFPRYAKQFKTKLQASGWNLVNYDPAKSSKQCRTTGFSGTNDSRHQLPMTIKQGDLPQLLHTNAEVLYYLLEKRNRDYVHTVDGCGKRLSEVGLLHSLHNPRNLADWKLNPDDSIKILIDAGAQILEHDNLSLAKAWLNIDKEAAASIYFGDDHRAYVVYRTGKITLLATSPFKENMEKCLVYFDESHCRGTDLKLPPAGRAALTLGQHLTKDAFTQAAMRLRLLGQTQAVTLYSPPEVHQSILALREKYHGAYLDSRDVIAWLLEQSCRAINLLEPLYYSQGIAYVQQMKARIDNPDFLDHETARKTLLSVAQIKELQTLKQLYAPKKGRRAKFESSSQSLIDPLLGFAENLVNRKAAFKDDGAAAQADASDEVEIEIEREREVEHEVESVRENQLPPSFRALKYLRLHKDIAHFVICGRLPPGSEAYSPMFTALHKTALGMKHGGMLPMKANLFVSTEFSRTVNVMEPHDHYVRPSQWVIWSSLTEKALLVSPEEANDLVPILRGHSELGPQFGHTHLIVYSAPVTRRTLHFNTCDFYAIPSLPENFKAPTWLNIELGIFSGKLYFEWSEYHDLLTHYLGEKIEAKPGDEAPATATQGFAKKPLTFLHEWLALRRKGQDFEHTPMGYVTTGKPLTEDHAFFAARSVGKDDMDLRSSIPSARRPGHVDEENDEEDHYDDEEHSVHVYEDQGDQAEDYFLDAASDVASDDEVEFRDALELPDEDVESMEADKGKAWGDGA